MEESFYTAISKKSQNHIRLTMSTPTITVAYGDGIGPEIMRSVLTIIEKTGTDMNVDCIDIGEKLYKKRLKAGIEPATWDVIRRNKVFLNPPITTPQGTGVKSLTANDLDVIKTENLYEFDGERAYSLGQGE